MKILILGSDGYIGYPLIISLLKDNHQVMGIDDHSRRERVKEISGGSLTPILKPFERRRFLKHNYKNYSGELSFSLGEVPSSFLSSILKEFKPDTIVHLAEQPSAPWSMKSAEHAKVTQLRNVIGTLDLLWAMKEQCPSAHLVKLGTMGEYGTPNCDIPEGRIPSDVPDCGGSKCPMAGLLFPRTPGSFYHLSKVHDTFNIEFACRNWGLRSTDIMQGVLFGVKIHRDQSIDEITRFDYDQYFGTVINRFCTQAIIGHPLTIYGRGNQTRGFLPLKDSIQCLKIAINNPPLEGDYRTFNQYESIHKLNDLAEIIRSIIGSKLQIDHIYNPRLELEDHRYDTTNSNLLNLGYVPTTDIRQEISDLISDILPYASRVNSKSILPTTDWR